MQRYLVGVVSVTPGKVRLAKTQTGTQPGTQPGSPNLCECCTNIGTMVSIRVHHAWEKGAKRLTQPGTQTGSQTSSQTGHPTWQPKWDTKPVCECCTNGTVQSATRLGKACQPANPSLAPNLATKLGRPTFHPNWSPNLAAKMGHQTCVSVVPCHHFPS
jgi:hypothetical protein